MPPTFFLAIGRDPRRRDIDLCLAVGQREFLVPAGTRGAKVVRALPGIRYVCDSGAWPIGNPDRVTLPAYARLLAEAERDNYRPGSISQKAWFAWGASYDHILSREATERDEAAVFNLIGGREIGIVPIVTYPWASADDIIGQALADLDMLDEQEIGSFWLGKQMGEVVGPVDHPAVGIGGLVPARYSREAAYWLESLMDDLGQSAERAKGGQFTFDFDPPSGFSAIDLDPFLRRVHLFGVAKPSWVLHPSGLVMSCDSSGPFQMAKYGFQKARTAPFEKYGFSTDKLQRSREACLVMHLCHYRDRLGLPYTTLDEHMLLDDAPRRVFAVSAAQSRRQVSLDDLWSLDLDTCFDPDLDEVGELLAAA
ncbi:MAG: hypothetical protein M3R24_08230 [Chloroflexota bacterium]|nr:hypothetical protein [Chloroflexota bacterium]